MRWLRWQVAWQAALYAADGFYQRGSGPAGHFATAAHGVPATGTVLAESLVGWLRAEGLSSFVDIGAARGQLARLVHHAAPDVAVTGVDVVARPALPGPVGWLRSPGGPALPEQLAGLADVLVLANEWLDVVPCPVAQVDRRGRLREVEVRSDGAERLGGDLAAEDLAWVAAHWPLGRAEPGDRVEVGRARDEAWTDLVSRVRDGVVVAVDYGHLRAVRPRHGTLTGYRSGRPVPPVPDGSCDLTAHVAMDTLGADEVVDQRTVLRRLGVGAPAAQPRREAAGDPAAYLGLLSRTAAAGALTARGGFGDFWWAVRRVGRSRPAG